MQEDYEGWFWRLPGTHWLTRAWWDYIWTGGAYSKGRGRAGFSWGALWCRMNGHKPGIVFFNVGGLEPDTHCRGCDDDLG